MLTQIEGYCTRASNELNYKQPISYFSLLTSVSVLAMSFSGLDAAAADGEALFCQNQPFSSFCSVSGDFSSLEVLAGSGIGEGFCSRP